MRLGLLIDPWVRTTWRWYLFVAMLSIRRRIIRVHLVSCCFLVFEPRCFSIVRIIAVWSSVGISMTGTIWILRMFRSRLSFRSIRFILSRHTSIVSTVRSSEPVISFSRGGSLLVWCIFIQDTSNLHASRSAFVIVGRTIVRQSRRMRAMCPVWNEEASSWNSTQSIA